MSGWYPRLSPSGRHVASGHLDITVDGRVVSDDGVGPVWLDENTILFGRHSDGALMRWSFGDATPSVVRAEGGNGIAAASGRWVIYRTDPVRLIWDTGVETLGVRDPALSDDFLWIADLDQNTGALLVNNAIVDSRPCLNPRWGSSTLCWETGAQIFGSSTPYQPITALSILPHQYKPVPIWTGASLWVLSHTDNSVILQPWGGHEGYVVYRGETDAPHDARALDAAHIRVVWSVGGVLHDVTIDLSSFRVDLLDNHQPVPQPTPQPVPQPVPSPVPAPTPHMPDYSAVVADVRRKYTAPLGFENAWKIVNEVALRLRQQTGDDNWGIHRKGGTNFNGYSIDIVGYRATGALFDVLGDAEGQGNPGWSQVDGALNWAPPVPMDAPGPTPNPNPGPTSNPNPTPAPVPSNDPALIALVTHTRDQVAAIAQVIGVLTTQVAELAVGQRQEQLAQQVIQRVADESGKLSAQIADVKSSARCRLRF